MSQNFLQTQKFRLSGSGVTSAATSIILQSFAFPDGTNITDSSLGTTNYGTLEPGTTKEEIISFTGVTQNASGTATLTGVTRGLKFGTPYTEDASLKQSHSGGAIFIVSNNPQMYEDLISFNNDETITGEWTFPAGGNAKAPKSGASYSEPTDDLELASKKYIDDIAIAGSPKATDSVYGISKLSTAAASATEPIVVGDNDNRVSPVSLATVDADQVDALAGTAGTPSSTNKYVTDEDTTGTGDVVRESALPPFPETLPAYEDLVVGDLLKTINDEGTYKLKKIVGIGDEISDTAQYDVDYLSFCYINTDKIIIFYEYSNDLYAQAGTISGATLTFGTVVVVTSSNAIDTKDLFVRKVADDRFILAYNHFNGASTTSIKGVAGSVSGTTITLGTAVTPYTDAHDSNLRVYGLVEVDTSKFVVAHDTYGSAPNAVVVLDVNVSDGITLGSEVNLDDDDVYIRIEKLETDVFIAFYYDSSEYATFYRVCSVSGTVITVGSIKTFIAPGDTAELGDNYNIVQAGENSGIIAYSQNQATTLKLVYYTRIGDTLTFSTATSFIDGCSTAFSNLSFDMIIFGNYLYTFEKAVGLKKFSFTSSGEFVLLQSLAETSRATTGKFMDKTETEILLSTYNVGNQELLKFTPLLLDYDEFITSANTTYNIDVSVPIVDVFTGFSSLLNGLDYYINADASGLTINSTYQKVGKAINDTTIIK